MNPVLIANEVVKDYRSKNKKGWILKLDLEKGFDRVECEFLEKVLHGKKFDNGMHLQCKVLYFHPWKTMGENSC